MNKQRKVAVSPVRFGAILSQSILAGPILAGSILAGSVLLGFCAAASAQSDAVHRYVDARGQEVTVYSGQPKPDNFGPRPTFAQLDRNHDGYISRDEAEAYPPLANDFDYLTHGERISAAQYARWNHH